jgi:hypothetical protein
MRVEEAIESVNEGTFVVDATVRSTPPAGFRFVRAEEVVDPVEEVVAVAAASSIAARLDVVVPTDAARGSAVVASARTARIT